MVRQADIFRESEGDAWFKRNRDRLGERDPVSEAIASAGIVPTSVLEIGCANGWRLARLRDRYQCKVLGIEPSQEACMEAATLRVPTMQAIASNVLIQLGNYGMGSRTEGDFDLVIFGFCLYLTDPSEWFTIVAGGDSVLRDFGHIIIHDFAAEGQFFARNYRHHDGVMSYHFDFDKMWLAHPWYHVVGRLLYPTGEAITILKKSPVTEVRP